ncbi:MAG: hypothetical protein M1374_03825 [Firmicutes bacterium]|nr:hypothetical protein [Bacillota bacterium]
MSTLYSSSKDSKRIVKIVSSPLSASRKAIEAVRHGKNAMKALLLISVFSLIVSACSSSSTSSSLSPAERAVSMAWVSSGAVFIVAGGVTQPTQVNFPTYAVPVPSDVAVSASGHYATFLTPRPSGPGDIAWVYDSGTRHLQEIHCGALTCGVPGFAGDVFVGETSKSNGLVSHLILLPPGNPIPIRVTLSTYPKVIPGSGNESIAATAQNKAKILGLSEAGPIESVPLKNASGALSGKYALFLLNTDGVVQPFGVVSEVPKYDVSQPNTKFVAILLGKAANQKVEIVNVSTGKVKMLVSGLAGLTIQTIFSANSNWYLVGKASFACTVCAHAKSGSEVVLELKHTNWSAIKSGTITDGPFDVGFSGASGDAFIKSGKLETVAPLGDISFSS